MGWRSIAADLGETADGSTQSRLLLFDEDGDPHISFTECRITAKSKVFENCSS
jgi:hypothetical protein